MTKEPAPDERYRDALTKNVFKVVGLATSVETCKRLVIYRLSGRERLFTVSLDRWEELLDTDVLTFVSDASVSDPRPLERPPRSAYPALLSLTV